MSRNKGRLSCHRESIFLFCYKKCCFGAKPDIMLMDHHIHFHDDELEASDNKDYGSLIGKLLHVMVTRLDVSLAAGKLSQFMEKDVRLYNWKHMGFPWVATRLWGIPCLWLASIEIHDCAYVSNVTQNIF